MPNFELTPLDVESDATKHPVEKGKSKKLLEAYKEAAENKDLAHFKGLLADHQKYVEEEEAVAAEKTKKIKKARKSGDTSTLLDNADEMDIDNEPIAEKPTSKKRKKVHDNDETEEKVTRYLK